MMPLTGIHIFFVCVLLCLCCVALLWQLNPVTTDEDLELIFSRFGEIKRCDIIKDFKTGDSLQYAFIEYSSREECERAYFKMNNVLIDDHRIKVDFNQSTSKVSKCKQKQQHMHKQKQKQKHNQKQKQKHNHKQKQKHNHKQKHKQKQKHNHNQSHNHNLSLAACLFC